MTSTRTVIQMQLCGDLENACGQLISVVGALKKAFGDAKGRLRLYELESTGKQEVDMEEDHRELEECGDEAAERIVEESMNVPELFEADQWADRSADDRACLQCANGPNGTSLVELQRDTVMTKEYLKLTIKQLVNEGLLVTRGRARGTRYYTPEAVERITDEAGRAEHGVVG
jgi:hypothetical protein